MVTGASTADAVIILVDVSKVKLGEDGSVELLTQTKRHSTIAHLLQIQHVIVAVNKMDLVDYDQTVYDRIVGAYQQFAQQLACRMCTPSRCRPWRATTWWKPARACPGTRVRP